MRLRVLFFSFWLAIPGYCADLQQAITCVGNPITFAGTLKMGNEVLEGIYVAAFSQPTQFYGAPRVKLKHHSFKEPDGRVINLQYKGGKLIGFAVENNSKAKVPQVDGITVAVDENFQSSFCASEAEEFSRIGRSLKGEQNSILAMGSLTENIEPDYIRSPLVQTILRSGGTFLKKAVSPIDCEVRLKRIDSVVLASFKNVLDSELARLSNAAAACADIARSWCGKSESDVAPLLLPQVQVKTVDSKKMKLNKFCSAGASNVSFSALPRVEFDVVNTPTPSSEHSGVGQR